jgi:chromosome segregation ATPase
MALTAARSELNVALVGESDVSAMLELTKKQMGELETKIRSLTGASQAQTAAAKASESGLESVNGKMKGLAGRAENLVGGIDKMKGAFEKVVGAFGFVGMAITGAVTAFDFLKENFGETEKKTEELRKEFDAARKQADDLTASIHALVAATRAAQSAIGAQALKVAGLRADLAEAQGKTQEAILMRAEQRADAVFEQADEADRKAAEVQLKLEELTGKEKQAQAIVSNLSQKEDEIRLKAQKEISALKAGDAMEALKQSDARKKIKEAADAEIVALRAKAGLNSLNNEALADAIAAQRRIKAGFEQEAQAARELGEQLSYNTVELEKQTSVVQRGGGGGGRSRESADMAALREAERKQFLEWLGDTQREAAALNKLRADSAKADEVRRKAVRDEAALFDELGAMRAKVTVELGNLPTTGVTAEAFEDVRKKLAKQLAEIDRMMAARVQASRDGGMTTAEEDAITAALARQREEMEKLTGMTEDLAEARGKAARIAAEELEKARLAKPLEDLEEYKAGIGQLTQMAVPAFGEIGTVLSQVTDQLARYKDGQTSMAKAVTGSASSIAGAIAKQVGGVKAEAGVRAIFETAMGFATLVSNPVESAGHFTAAAMFGLAAGGVLKTGASSGAGGQKAPATRTASTTASSNTGGGGPITNVYNLQTGIVDGQSTARAFRQAEQQARNTGMASAGGW